jgi:antirestriction protein ArdC
MDQAERNARVRELHAELERSVAKLVEGDDWRAMLETAARFHPYSFGNVMLIMSQRPDATRVAGFQTWKTFGRHVRRGERGIRILAPCRYTIDDADADEERWVLRGFKVEHVFDISQTDGEPIADVRPELLSGEAPSGLWDGLAAQAKAAGFTVERGDCGGANGVTRFDVRTVRVRDDVDDAQACKTLAHELGHVLMHEAGLAHGCRGRIEVEAESVAYIVAAASDLPTDGYSLPYVARWADGDTQVVRDTAERVIGAAGAILAALAEGEDDRR